MSRVELDHARHLPLRPLTIEQASERVEGSGLRDNVHVCCKWLAHGFWVVCHVELERKHDLDVYLQERVGHQRIDAPRRTASVFNLHTRLFVIGPRVL